MTKAIKTMERVIELTKSNIDVNAEVWIKSHVTDAISFYGSDILKLVVNIYETSYNDADRKTRLKDLVKDFGLHYDNF